MALFMKNSRLAAAWALMFCICSQPYAAVFSCHSPSGGRVYTSEASAGCSGAELPKISSHQGSGYRLKVAGLDGAHEEKIAKKRGANRK